MNIILLMIKKEPIIFLSIFLFFIFLLTFIIQYIYISYNLKGICKIIFDDEKHFKLPLEPFNSYFLSCFPLVFWRETLNIKKGIHFKKLYRKEFYYPVNKVQLKRMITQYPKFFYIQYLIFISGILWFFFMMIAYSINKFL